MVLKRLFFLLCFVPWQLWAVHNPAYYGEKDFDNYFGPRELLFDFDPYQGQLQFEDDKLNKDYFDYLISPELKDYHEFFFGPLSNALSCPQQEMNQMYDYLRFANRVIALSYIYESLRLEELTAKKLGEKNPCHPNWTQVLNKCHAKSKDMKLFISNAHQIVKNDKASLLDVSHSIKQFQKKWQASFNKHTYLDVAQYRVKLYCEEIHCERPLGVEAAKNILKKTCQQDIQEFIQICSEEDNLYGLSDVHEAYPLLGNSDILTLFNSEGHALGCLRRFKQQNQGKEVSSKLLKAIFPIVYQKMGQQSERFIQGPLFFAGTLRQFAEKGLKSIYQQEKPKKSSKKIVAKKAAPVLFKKQEDKVEFIDRRVKVKKKKTKVVVQKRPKKKKAPKKSSFLVAVELRDQLDMDAVKVDMLRFKYDFLFSIALKKMLDKNLEIYTTRKGLEQMKKYDQLGSKQGPMPLMFLKYLIETGKHQALYNILNILGESFYVNNDIDRLATTKADYISLQNGASTDNQWQIFVLKESSEQEESSLAPEN